MFCLRRLSAIIFLACLTKIFKSRCSLGDGCGEFSFRFSVRFVALVVVVGWSVVNSPFTDAQVSLDSQTVSLKTFTIFLHARKA